MGSRRFGKLASRKSSIFIIPRDLSQVRSWTAFQSLAGRNIQSARAIRNKSKVSRGRRGSENWRFQGWKPEHALPQDDSKNSMLEVRLSSQSGNSPQESEPHGQRTIQSRDYVLALPLEPSQEVMVGRTEIMRQQAMNYDGPGQGRRTHGRS